MIKRHMVSVLQKAGWAIHRVPRPNVSATEVTLEQDLIQYACGYNYMPGWLNVDIITGGPDNYLYVNLVEQHPFPDNHFRFAVCEDFVEHVGQADSLVFFEEVHRTLRPGGVFRLTFPCLEGVLAKHFVRSDFQTYSEGRAIYFAELGHVHYYSRKSLATVAAHIGFDIEFCEVKLSKHRELQGLDTRDQDVNLYVELTKRDSA